MNTSLIFNEFLTNLKVQNTDQISRRYNSITKSLNKKIYNQDSDLFHSLKVGSYGRNTAVNGISDLDMIFELPYESFRKYDGYQTNGQSALLQDIKNAILGTYSTTDIRGDGQVVVVTFTNHVIEVCPVFLQSDGTYKFPDSNNGGKWKITNPRPEIDEMNIFDQTTNSNLKNLAKITRAWKNKCGVKIGGLLIDTLCYEFFKKKQIHQNTTIANYHLLVRDFFEFLKDYDRDRQHWFAPGSNQKVYRKQTNFISKSKKAYDIVLEAISKNENDTVYAVWKKVFGYPFPYPKALNEASTNYTNQEEYIEDLYQLDITNMLRIDCEVSQEGYRTELLRNMFGKLKTNKKLKFFIVSTDVKKPYLVKWKVKNEGQIAKTRDNLRGQILNDDGTEIRKENSNFGGSHFVECYIIKNDICVARDRVEVPISNL